MSNDLTVVSDNELFDAFGSAGFGEFAEDMKFPFLTIAAKNSDAIVEGSDRYIDGLKAGFFFNSRSQRVYGKTVQVIILDYRTIWKEHTRKATGGKDKFVRVVPDAEIKTFTRDQILDYTKHFLPNGNMLEEVKLFHVVLPQFKEDGIVQMSFTKGSFKHVRNWGNLVVRTGDPFPAHIWEVSTGLVDDGKNDTYFSIGTFDTTFVKDLGRIADKELLSDVKESYLLVNSILNQSAVTGVKNITHIEEEKVDEIPY